MKPMKRIVAAIAAMVFDAYAADTWLLSKLETTTADSAETNAIYGYQVFSNEASKVTVKVEAQAVNLIASTIASDGTEGYTANFGLLLPLTPDWVEHDLTGLTSITFEYQNDATITDVLSVSFGSTAYTDAIANAGTVYSNDLAGASARAAGTAWKQGEVLVADFATPSWWTDIPEDFPKLDTVLKHVKNLQFAPKTSYLVGGSQKGVECKLCVTPTMTSLTFKIRNIVLHGVSGDGFWPNEPFLGCEASQKKFPLDGFASGSKNTLGGDWFVFSDFDSTGLDTDPAKGASVVSDSIYTADAYMAMSAQLKKNVGGVYHKYAGWAAIGTSFGEGGLLDATGLTGIGFQLADLGINPDRVQNIAFKVKMKGVDDTAIHQVLLPTSAIVEAKSAGKAACILPGALAQPSYVLASQKVPFDVSKIEQISWEAKITDDRTSSIDTATANFLLTNVVLYGVDAPVVGVRTPVRTRTAVGYSNGILQLSGFTGATRFDVRRLDGQLVASFGASRRLALALPRGTYLLAASGQGVHFANKFTVLNP
jgi:hypothetical protein